MKQAWSRSAFRGIWNESLTGWFSTPVVMLLSLVNTPVWVSHKVNPRNPLWHGGCSICINYAVKAVRIPCQPKGRGCSTAEPRSRLQLCTAENNGRALGAAGRVALRPEPAPAPAAFRAAGLGELQPGRPALPAIRSSRPCALGSAPPGSQTCSQAQEFGTFLIQIRNLIWVWATVDTGFPWFQISGLLPTPVSENLGGR